MKSTFQSHSLVGDAAHIPDATTEQKYGESKPCSFPMTGAPSTCPPSVPLDSKSGSSLFPSSQPVGEEPPYLPPVELLDSTIEIWEWIVANEKTDQEVTDEGLRHFYEGINCFCLLSERHPRKQSLYFYEVMVRSAYNLPSPDPTCGISLGMLLLLSERHPVVTDKYNEAAKVRDDMEKMNSSLKAKLAKASRKRSPLCRFRQSFTRLSPS